MKKMTIIALLTVMFLAVCCLTAIFLAKCGDYEALREEVSLLRTELEAQAEVQSGANAELSSSIASLSAQISELESSLSEVSKSDTKKETTTTTETVVTSKTPAKELQVTAVYNKRYFVIPTQTDANKKRCVENPTILPYKEEDGKVRDLSLLVSGPAVKSVFWVDEKFQEIEGLSFNRVEDITHIYFYMENDGFGGDYFFKIVTEANTEVYFGVYYGLDR